MASHGNTLTFPHFGSHLRSATLIRRSSITTAITSTIEAPVKPQARNGFLWMKVEFAIFGREYLGMIAVSAADDDLRPRVVTVFQSGLQF